MNSPTPFRIIDIIPSIPKSFIIVLNALNLLITTSLGASPASNSNKYTLLYNSFGKNETAFRTVSTTLKANTEYYIIFAYTKDSSGDRSEDKMFIQSIDIE